METALLAQAPGREVAGSLLCLALSLGAAGGVRLLGRPMEDGPAFGHGSDHGQGSQLGMLGWQNPGSFVRGCRQFSVGELEPTDEQWWIPGEA